ncbi:MAG: heme exporter protein CcmB [Gammaproteobacteria bacterium]|nr:heme exporter protein CcmB [Gammaproteobacteria bacterium]
MLSTPPASLAILRREMLRLYRRRGQLMQPPLFFILVAVMFPFAVGGDENQLRALAPAVVWVALLLATTLSLEDIFRGDHEDGSLEQLVLLAGSLPGACALKALAHWLSTPVPLIAMAALMSAVHGLQNETRTALLVSLLLGTPVFSLVGTIGSALTVGVRGGALLLALLILPLYIPVLIFGAGAVRNATLSMASGSEYFFLAGLSVLAATLAPFAAAAGLRARLV